MKSAKISRISGAQIQIEWSLPHELPSVTTKPEKEQVFRRNPVRKVGFMQESTPFTALVAHITPPGWPIVIVAYQAGRKYSI
jgi:hypothetical protein